jgi:hypothetical protein
MPKMMCRGSGNSAKDLFEALWSSPAHFVIGRSRVQVTFPASRKNRMRQPVLTVHAVFSSAKAADLLVTEKFFHYDFLLSELFF